VYSRFLPLPDTSFFLFGPRGTGKSSWARVVLQDAPTVDLLAADTCNRLLGAPQELEGMIPDNHRGWVFIDEIQKVPALLDEVHRLIEGRGLRFALTGSSARKIRRCGGNLLAGRARTHTMLPLTAGELGADFDLGRYLRQGGLPGAWNASDPEDFLASYVNTYLQEEVQQEGITRNIPAFARFLRTASFCQASFLNISAVARECGVERKVVEQWFLALEDLLLAVRLPVFRRRANRSMTAHAKFFLFDAGVYRTLRPRGPLDSSEEIDGAALETFVLNELRAANTYRKLGYELHSWRTASKKEVDFVLYGSRGLHAIEVVRTPVVRGSDLAGLLLFKVDYPEARSWLVYGGRKRELRGGVEIIPAGGAIGELLEAL
jgi:predicted AAA+ superfamily ATPase